MRLMDDTILLREIEENDNQMLKEMMNSPEIEKVIGGWSFPVSDGQQRVWSQNINADDSSVRYVIEYQERGIGMASITGIDWKNRSGEVNIKIANTNQRGIGIGKKAIYLLIRYAFQELNLECITATVLSYNCTSKKMFETCGFKMEGLLRNRVYKCGNYHDLIQYSILKEEYTDRRG